MWRGEPTALKHDVGARHGFNGPHQHRMRRSGPRRYDIEQMVDPVAKVDIGHTRRPEHRLGSGRTPIAIGMAGFVIRAAVSFCLDDAPGSEVAIEVGAERVTEEGARYPYDIVGVVKCPWQSLLRVHLTPGVVGGFLGDGHIVRMAFHDPGIGDAHKIRLLQGSDIGCAAVTHPCTQAADVLQHHFRQ